jgi:hypothetical protein
MANAFRGTVFDLDRYFSPYVHAGSGQMQSPSSMEAQPESAELGNASAADAPMAVELKWTVASWLRAVELLPTHLKTAIGQLPEGQQLATIASLDPAALAQLFTSAGLQGKVAASVIALAKAACPAPEVTGAALNDKFRSDGDVFEMAYGGLKMYHKGLGGLLGEPRMVDGSLMKGMQAEHCEGSDSRTEFTTDNYGVSTTSCLEWWYNATLTTRYDARAHAQCATHPHP